MKQREKNSPGRNFGTALWNFMSYLWGGRATYCALLTSQPFCVHARNVLHIFLQIWNGIILYEKILDLRDESAARSRIESDTKPVFCVGMMTGRAYFTVLVSFVLLSRLLRDGGAIRCTETKPLLRELGERVSQLSECMLECSGMTYFKKLQLQDKRTIKFQVSTEGEVPSCRCRVSSSSSASHFLNSRLWPNALGARFITYYCCLQA